MWFIGMLIGLLLGSVVGFGERTLWGGLFGALAGAVFAFFSKQSLASSIEPRLAALESAIADLPTSRDWRRHHP